MNSLVWVALGCLLLTLPMAAAEPGVKIQVVGGTVSAISAKSGGRVDLTGNDTLVVQCGKIAILIPYPKINTVEYGQSVSRRYAEAVLLSPIFLLAKSRKHFVTLGYVDTDGKQQALVFRVEKGDIRSLLAALEARTGRRVEYQDQEARKAGKG
jgi:hypothetical protein